MNPIRAVRKYRRISRQEISSEIGVDETTIARYERRARNPSIAALTALSKSLGVRIVDLLDEFEISLMQNLTIETLYRQPFNPDGEKPLFSDKSFTIKHNYRKALIQAARRFGVVKKYDGSDPLSGILYRTIFKKCRLEIKAILNQEKVRLKNSSAYKGVAYSGILLPSTIFDSQSRT